jgi:hypothetical protein
MMHNSSSIRNPACWFFRWLGRKEVAGSGQQLSSLDRKKFRFLQSKAKGRVPPRLADFGKERERSENGPASTKLRLLSVTNTAAFPG